MELYLLFIADTLQGGEKVRSEWRDIDWRKFYQFAAEQAVLGVVFEGIVRYENKLKDVLPKDVLFQWIGDAEQIKRQNAIVNQKCAEIAKYFAEKGFKNCILKGQGNAAMYPNPFSRNSGDIDIWVDGTKEELIRLVTSVCPDAEIASHHIEFPLFKEVPVEVHFFPSFSVVKRYDKRWKQFVDNHKQEQFLNEIRLPDCDRTIVVPTIEFNIIYQLSHMMRHFFYEGIGLRHVIDYYYLLKKFRVLSEESEQARAESLEFRDSLKFQKLFKDLGMLRFAEGLMWIERDCLGLGDDFLIASPDEKRGQLILSEIYEGGNFGKNDSRMATRLANKSKTLSVIVRNLKLMRLFPEEAVASPIDGVIRRFFKQ